MPFVHFLNTPPYCFLRSVKLCVFAISFLWLIFLPNLSCAQNIDNQQLPLDRILQQRNLENQEQKLLKKPIVIPKEKKEIEDKKDVSGRCIEVENVELNDVKVLSSRKQKQFKESVIGKCIDSVGIGNFLKEITNYYIGKGYSNSRVYFEKYNPSTKTITLQIAEGKIAEILLNDIAPQKKEKSQENQNNHLIEQNSFFDKTQLFFAVPASSGEVFNVRDFEQGLNNFNRLRSNNAVLESRPGEREGESDIIINNYKNDNDWQVSINYENSGSKSTGLYNTTYAINKDNLLQINENINLSQIKSDRSQTNIIGFSVPFGYWNFRYQDSSNEYSSFTNNGVRIEGTSTNHDLSLDRLLFRDKASELNLNSNLNFRNQTRKVSGVTDIASQRLSTARIGFDYTLRSSFAITNFSFAYSKGLKIHSAIDDKKDFSSPLSKDSPRAQFEKYTYNLNVYKPLNEYLSYNLQGTIQHSPDSLYSPELIYVGGSKYSVRGLQYDGIFGSKGGYARNDLNFDLGRFLGKLQIGGKSKIAQKVLNEANNIRLNIFYDSGYARSIVDSNDPVKTEYISGAGFGARYYGKYFNFDFTYAANLKAPSNVIVANDYKNSAIYFGVGGKYEF